jgi:hypothetical protein
MIVSVIIMPNGESGELYNVIVSVIFALICGLMAIKMPYKSVFWYAFPLCGSLMFSRRQRSEYIIVFMQLMFSLLHSQLDKWNYVNRPQSHLIGTKNQDILEQWVNISGISL